MSNKYLENRMKMHEKGFEYPKHVKKAFTNCKTKLRHQVSKVIVQGSAPDNIAKEILEWVSQTKPIVVQGKENRK